MTARYDADRVARELSEAYGHKPGPTFVARLEQRLAEQADAAVTRRRRFPALPRFSWLPPNVRPVVEGLVLLAPIVVLSLVLWKTGLIDPSPADPAEATALATGPAADATGGPKATTGPEATTGPDAVASGTPAAVDPQAFPPTWWEPATAVSLTVSAAQVAQPAGWSTPITVTVVRAAFTSEESTLELDFAGVLNPVAGDALAFRPFVLLADGSRFEPRADADCMPLYAYPASVKVRCSLPPLPPDVDAVSVGLPGVPYTAVAAVEPWRAELRLVKREPRSTMALSGVRAVNAGIAIAVTDVAYYDDMTLVRLLIGPGGATTMDDLVWDVADGSASIVPSFSASASEWAPMLTQDGRVIDLQSTSIVIPPVSVASAHRLASVSANETASGRITTLGKIARPLTEVPAADPSRDGTTQVLALGPVPPGAFVTLALDSMSVADVPAAEGAITVSDGVLADRSPIPEPLSFMDIAKLQPSDWRLSFAEGGVEGAILAGDKVDPSTDFDGRPGGARYIDTHVTLIPVQDDPSLAQWLERGVRYGVAISPGLDWPTPYPTSADANQLREYLPVASFSLIGARWWLTWHTGTGEAVVRPDNYVFPPHTDDNVCLGCLRGLFLDRTDTGFRLQDQDAVVWDIRVDPSTPVGTSDGEPWPLDALVAHDPVTLEGYYLGDPATDHGFQAATVACPGREIAGVVTARDVAGETITVLNGDAELMVRYGAEWLPDEWLDYPSVSVIVGDKATTKKMPDLEVGDAVRLGVYHIPSQGRDVARWGELGRGAQSALLPPLPMPTPDWTVLEP